MEFQAITIINGKKSESHDCMVLDQGVNFGKGVFETIAVVGSTPVFLKEHCERLKKGLTALGIDNAVRQEQITAYMNEFAIADCAMKVLVTPKNIVVNTRENIYSGGQFKEGFKVSISALKRNPHSHVVFHKTINYTDNIIENELAHKAGFNEAIFTNVYGFLAEGSVSNLFFVSKGRIFTPSIGCGILSGIVRDWVLRNYVVEEGEFTLEELFSADAVFLTNSLMGIMPVRQIQDKLYSPYNRKCAEIQEGYKVEVQRQVEN